MDNQVGYSGWIGHNNIGDEALLEANRCLFNEVEFVDARHWNGYESLLFGGGTVLPHFLLSDTFRPKRGTQCTAGIGVGVRSQKFWNQRLAPLDIRYIMGRAGFPELTRNRYVQYVLEPIEKLSSNVLATGYYFSESDYLSIGNYEFDHLGVRGPLSEEILSAHNIDCEVVGDTALILEPSLDDIEQKKVAVCLQQDKLKWARNDRYLHHLIKFLDDLPSDYDIILLPFQKEDISIHINLCERINNAELRNYCSPMDVQGAINEIASCEFMIGEKLHANILSACSYTPFISLEYRPKCYDFAASLEMDYYNIRIDELTGTKLKSVFNDLNSNRGNLISHLQTEVDEKRSDLRDFAKKVATDMV